MNVHKVMANIAADILRPDIRTATDKEMLAVWNRGEPCFAGYSCGWDSNTYYKKCELLWQELKDRNLL
jgi:hypothetical protein